jgi:hypothetical protein
MMMVCVHPAKRETSRDDELREAIEQSHRTCDDELEEAIKQSHRTLPKNLIHPLSLQYH